MTRWILRKAFSLLGQGDSKYPIKLIFSNGETYQNVPGSAEITIRFKNKSAERRTVLFDNVGFIESYMQEHIDIIGDDALRKLIRMSYELSANANSGFARFKNPLVKILQWRQEMRQNNKNFEQAKKNAYAHYNLPAEFFRLMNGELYGYTEGYYQTGRESRDEAQYKKYDYMCRKLRLQKGDRLVEVGSAWGTMALVAAGKYGADVVNYGLVEGQNRVMQKRAEEAGLGHKIKIVVKDARELANEPNAYDKYISLGVYEHAGKDCQREWIEAIATALKPGGVGVISTTGRMRHQLLDYLMAKYIWPGGYLPSIPHMLEIMEEYDLHVVDMESSRFHYATTMEAYVAHMLKHWSEIQAIDPTIFTESFRRIWMVYYYGSIETFRAQGQTLDAFQMTFVKGRGYVYPPTREFLYAEQISVPENIG